MNKMAIAAQLSQARPYLRTAIALLMKLRSPDATAAICYDQADLFVDRLEKDVAAQE